MRIKHIVCGIIGILIAWYIVVFGICWIGRKGGRDLTNLHNLVIVLLIIVLQLEQPSTVGILVGNILLFALFFSHDDLDHPITCFSYALILHL